MHACVRHKGFDDFCKNGGGLELHGFENILEKKEGEGNLQFESFFLLTNGFGFFGFM